MKIMIHGTWHWPQYEDAFARGLRDNGVNLVKSRVYASPDPIGRALASLPLAGPDTWTDARAILRRAKREKPDAVLFWRPMHVLGSTLISLSEMGITTISYNNDDPFSPQITANPKWRIRQMWGLYRKALPYFDLNFFYRSINCREALAAGAKHAETMLPYFLPWQDRPIELGALDRERFASDIVFVGHYEDDGRDSDMCTLAETGMSVRIWGDNSWQHSRAVLSSRIPKPIVPALGLDYAKALAGAKICLCYMSKLNRDGYTRRCFEIPAVGGVMLAERTPELTAIFQDGEEACFFSSQEELIEKAQVLLASDKLRQRISEAGRRRVLDDGHDVFSRARQFLEVLF